MFYSKWFLLIALSLGTTHLFAQDFSSAKELRKYYKDNTKKFPTPEEGWHEAWVILPGESEFITDLEGEVVDAKIFLEKGEVKKVYYENYDYCKEVFALGSPKKGKAQYQKVILDMNNNLTEVFTAYTHTIFFKNDTESVDAPLKSASEAGKMTFYSREKKIDKRGFYVFVRNEKTKQFDFLGYLNKNCDDPSECNLGNSIQLNMKNGEYDFMSVKNKIQVNRKMPTKSYQISVKESQPKSLELTSEKEN